MNAYGQNILQLLPADSLQFFTQAHKISVPKKEKDFLYFWSCKFLPVISCFQGIKSIHGSSHGSPMQCASLFTCTQLSTRQNELHGSRRTLHCKLHATLTLHYTQHYTLHYTQHYRNAASGQKNWLVFSFHSLKASKLQNAAPASSSVVLRAV